MKPDSSSRSDEFDYDFAGNLKNDPTTPANAILYDAENRQVSYTKAGTTTYSYDGDGHRVKKVTGSITTIFVYNASGELTAEYTNDTAPPVGGGGTSYLTTDHLGSTRLVTGTNPTQPVKARYDYLPFGEEIPSSIGARGGVAGYGGADSTRQKFTQKERDNESGLDYFLARYYSSAQGRFTSADPARGSTRNPQSWNLYVYVTNNPLNSIDPFGLWKQVAPGVWQWQDGDDWKSLAQKTGIPKNKLKSAFDGAGLGPGSAPIDVNNLMSGYIHQTYASTDITPLFAGVARGMNRRATASQNLIVGFGAISLAPVVGIAGQAAVVGTGLTSLGVAGLGEGSFAVIGEEVATTQFIGSPGAIVLNLAKNTWSLAQNNAWIQQIVERRIPVFLASSLTRMADESGRVRQFGREVQQLLDAGYKQAGQWLLPPK